MQTGFLTDKVVVVTGAGGSIGSELSCQIAEQQPKLLLLLDSSEYNLYVVDQMLLGWGGTYRTLIQDVRDRTGLRRLFREHRPDYVFHAAALKHVPMLQDKHNLLEAIKTNVVGTANVADMSLAVGAKMVLVSTDKAVNPSSIMGTTKRIAELYVHGLAARHPSAKMLQVRFGNVMGSSGSVIPLFESQIEAGGPVTVTDARMTRYMMTIEDAVQLTLRAAELHRDGYGLYVLDMGEPVSIMALARKMIDDAGLRGGVDIEIKITGLRPGEKLTEELTYPWEVLKPTAVDRVMKADVTISAVQVAMLDSLLATLDDNDPHQAVAEMTQAMEVSEFFSREQSQII